MADDVFKRDVNRITTSGGIKDSSEEISQFRVDDTTKRLLVDATTVEAGYTTVATGTLYIKGAGDINIVHADISCDRVFIQASEHNVGPILVGGSSVAATVAIRQGLALYATQGTWFRITNLNKLYITSETKGDSISWYLED